MSEEFVKKVIVALGSEKYKWRTLKGVAEEAGCSEEDVLSVVSNKQEIIVKSSVPSKKGDQLFSTRKNYLKRRSALDGILGVLSIIMVLLLNFIL